MGFFSKLLGQDRAREKAQKELDAQKKLTEQARTDALAQQQATADANKAQNEALMAMQANAAALNDANNASANMEASTNVVAGGTATSVAQLRKKRTAPSLSASLGINA